MSEASVVSLQLKIKIPLTKQQVFDAAINWEGQNNWVYLTKVKAIDDSPNAVGKKLEAFTGISSIGFLDTMTITTWDEPNICIVEHTGNFVKGQGIFEARTINNETYFVWTERTILPFGVIGRIGWIFVKPVTALGLWVSLKRFSKYAQALKNHN